MHGLSRSATSHICPVNGSLSQCSASLVPASCSRAPGSRQLAVRVVAHRSPGSVSHAPGWCSEASVRCGSVSGCGQSAFGLARPGLRVASNRAPDRCALLFGLLRVGPQVRACRPPVGVGGFQFHGALLCCTVQVLIPRLFSVQTVAGPCVAANGSGLPRSCSSSFTQAQTRGARVLAELRWKAREMPLPGSEGQALAIQASSLWMQMRLAGSASLEKAWPAGRCCNAASRCAFGRQCVSSVIQLL